MVNQNLQVGFLLLNIDLKNSRTGIYSAAGHGLTQVVWPLPLSIPRKPKSSSALTQDGAWLEIKLLLLLLCLALIKRLDQQQQDWNQVLEDYNSSVPVRAPREQVGPGGGPEALSLYYRGT